MPTVVRVGQFRLYFWSREIDRIHIHVKHVGLGIEASVWMDNFAIKKSSGSSKIDRSAVELARCFRQEIIEAWITHFSLEGDSEDI